MEHHIDQDNAIAENSSNFRALKPITSAAFLGFEYIFQKLVNKYQKANNSARMTYAATILAMNEGLCSFDRISMFNSHIGT